MIHLSYKNNELYIQDSDGSSVVFSPESSKVMLDWFDVNHPGEYEKAGILLEVKDYNDTLFFKFLVDGKHVAIVTSDSFEITEDILWFFGDIDVLIIVGTKQAVKVFENIEAKLVVPYGDGKEVFLNTVWYQWEPETKHKVGADLSGDSTEFIYLD